MVSDQHVAGFAVVADQVVKTLRVRALLDHEGEIDAEALETNGRSHGVGMATRDVFAELGRHADRALVNRVGETE